MREILFRGKRVDNGEWVYGCYLIQNGRGVDGRDDIKLYQIYDEYGTQLVIPESVGQFTGLTDKNGTKIFEGDILKEVSKYGILLCEVLHIHISWVFKGIKSPNLFWNFSSEMITIGNIHDNRELLDEKA